MDAKRPPLPIVLTANDLLGGHSVYYAADGWTADPSVALIGGDDSVARQLETVGHASIVSADVVDPYLITVAPDGTGNMMPVHYRERIRVTGPTVAYGADARESVHVPV